jgi:hypothetical protein
MAFCATAQLRECERSKGYLRREPNCAWKRLIRRKSLRSRTAKGEDRYTSFSER